MPATSPSTASPAPGSLRVRRRRRVVGAKSLRGERGVAMLLVLTSIALLFVMAQQARDDVEVYSAAAAASRDEVMAYYQAKSMVNLSRLLLYSEPTVRRALTPVLAPIMLLMGRGASVPQIPVWEQADLILGMFRNRAAANAFGATIGLDLTAARGLGSLTGADPPTIVDEDSKININGFDRGAFVGRRVGHALVGLLTNPSLEPYFTQRDPDGQFTDRVTLISAIVDYADSDVDQFDAQSLLATTVNGSPQTGPEDSFYSTLHPPYLRRNAPFDSVEELHMVRGLGDDDLWHSVIDPDAGNPRRRTVTVWGQGAVNINTANAQTMLALVCAYAPVSPPTPQCTDPLQAARFITGITMLQAFTLSMGIPIFTQPHAFVDAIQGHGTFGTMLTALGVTPVTITGNDLEQALTTESKVFSIYTQATVGMAHVRIHAVVDMRPQPPIPSLFATAATGGREAASTSATVATGSGTTASTGTVTAAGGTVLYWRED